MANGLPTWSCVNLPNLRAPALLKPKSMIGSLVRESKDGVGGRQLVAAHDRRLAQHLGRLFLSSPG